MFVRAPAGLLVSIHFLQKDEGVDTATIVRLTKFSELNVSVPPIMFQLYLVVTKGQTIRVVFRFLFTVPLLILGVDGVRPHVHINESMLWTGELSRRCHHGRGE